MTKAQITEAPEPFDGILAERYSRVCGRRVEYVKLDKPSGRSGHVSDPIRLQAGNRAAFQDVETDPMTDPNRF